MGKASDLKKGDVIIIEAQPCVAKNIVVQSPSARGAATLYKVRFNNVKTRQKVDRTYHGDDVLEDASITRREAEFSYRESTQYVFMDVEDYNQYSLPEGALEDQTQWLSPGLHVVAVLQDDEIIAIELPGSVELPIVETAPALRGASATARTKAATLENGVEVQVPEYLEPGERIRVSTEDGRFLGRA